MRNKENEYREALGRFRGFPDKGHLGEKKNKWDKGCFGDKFINEL